LEEGELLLPFATRRFVCAAQTGAPNHHRRTLHTTRELSLIVFNNRQTFGVPGHWPQASFRG
jgi:hypothetical protein